MKGVGTPLLRLAISELVPVNPELKQEDHLEFQISVSSVVHAKLQSAGGAMTQVTAILREVCVFTLSLYI